MTHEQISFQLYESIKKYGFDVDKFIKETDMCDIEPEFLGFVKIYKYLSLMIEKDYTIYDFGAAFAPQGFYFRNHKKYIAINPKEAGQGMMEFPWGEYHYVTTGMFLEVNKDAGTKRKEFAICSYVPPWYKENSIKLVKNRFQNVFTFYP